MDALERIKAFHCEQFEDVDVRAPTFRGSPIHVDFVFPADASDEDIFSELRTSVKDSGWVLIKQSSKNDAGEKVYRVLACDHTNKYVFVNFHALARVPWMDMGNGDCHSSLVCYFLCAGTSRHMRRSRKRKEAGRTRAPRKSSARA